MKPSGEVDTFLGPRNQMSQFIYLSDWRKIFLHSLEESETLLHIV